MKSWLFEDAKNEFGRVVDLARKKGPQTVTRDGEAVAVVVSAQEFTTMTRPRESVLEFFAPLQGSGLRLSRSRELPCRIKF
jgi:antitoxin Phd